MFVFDIGDIVGAVLLGIFVLAYAWFWMAAKVVDWAGRRRERKALDKEWLEWDQ